MFNLNPIEILHRRKLDIMPVHFKYVCIADDCEDIDKWVKQKLKGRYFIGRCPTVDSDNTLRSKNFIGFEEQKELTYFMLACTLLGNLP